MNPQIEGAIRSIVIAIGGIAGSAGYLKDVDWVAIAGFLTSLLGLVWSLHSNSTKNLIAQTAGMDTVKEVVVKDPSLSAKIPNPKVTSTRLK